jgi:hypothetical protein
MNDDYILKFSPATGQRVKPPRMAPMTARDYRTQYPDTVWKFNPWAGCGRFEDYMREDPQGHNIDPVISGGVKRVVPKEPDWKKQAETERAGRVAMEKALSEGREHNARLESEMSRARDNHRNLRVELDAERKARRMLDEQLRRAQRDQGRLETLNRECCAALSKCRQEYGTLRDRNVELAGRLSDSAFSIATQVRKVVEQQKTINDLRCELEFSEGQRLFLREKLDAQNTSPLQSKIAKQSARITELERELEVERLRSARHADMGERLAKQLVAVREQRDWHRKHTGFSGATGRVDFSAGVSSTAAEMKVKQDEAEQQAQAIADGMLKTMERWWLLGIDPAKPGSDETRFTYFTPTMRISRDPVWQELPKEKPWHVWPPRDIFTGPTPPLGTLIDVEFANGWILRGAVVGNVGWNMHAANRVLRWRLA